MLAAEEAKGEIVRAASSADCSWWERPSHCQIRDLFWHSAHGVSMV